MRIKLGETKKPDPIIKNLTIPVSENMLTRYKKQLAELDRRQQKSLHAWARERLEALLNEMDEALAEKHTG